MKEKAEEQVIHRDLLLCSFIFSAGVHILPVPNLLSLLDFSILSPAVTIARTQQWSFSFSYSGHITFTCPNGRKCRDSSLHDETFLKTNLETLFAYRQAVGFIPGTMEPENGWMGELANDLIQLGKSIEKADDLPPLPKTPVWSDSKQLRREAIKKLALGQKLSRDDSQTMRMW